MNNLVFGILTILFCGIGYYFSWRYKVRDNYKVAVLLLVICGLALRIFTSTDMYLHNWDERYHALVAKNMIEHPITPTLYENPVLPYDYRNWPANHIWVHKQPLPLWVMASSMWIFGVNEIALRLPSILLTTLGIWLMFIIGAYFFGKKTGYLAALFYSVNGLIIELTGGRVATDHIDIFFLFFVELAIVFSISFVRRHKTVYTLLAGMSLGAAILSKWLPALIVVPVWLFIMVDSGQFKFRTILLQGTILLGVCVAVFLPWQLYIFKAFPAEASWEASFNFKHFTEVLDERTGPFWYFLDIIRINYGDLIYLPLIWFLWMTFKNPKDLKRMAILIWFLVPLIFFSMAKTKMQAYILFTCPALFLMTADFYSMIVQYKTDRKHKWVFSILLILLIALPARYTIERMKPFEIRERTPEWVVQLKELNSRTIEKGVLFNYDLPIEAMFYTDLTAYSEIPEKTIIITLMQEGYTVLLNDDGTLPEELKSLEGVARVRL